MKNALKTFRLPAAMLCCLPLVACTTTAEQAPPVSAPAPSTASVQPPQRSYLDPGPNPARTGGPAYVRANQTSAPRQTDFFGNDLLPQNP